MNVPFVVTGETVVNGASGIAEFVGNRCGGHANIHHEKNIGAANGTRFNRR